MATFKLELGRDMTKGQLRRRYGELVHAVGNLENQLLCLAAPNPEAVAKMPEPYRTKVQNLLKAYED